MVHHFGYIGDQSTRESIYAPRPYASHGIDADTRPGRSADCIRRNLAPRSAAAERNAQADLDTIVRQFLALKAPDAADHYSSVKCPSIILSGSEDGIHKSAFALKEQIPNCAMRILHGAGHACQMEQPWLFDRYMIEFLQDHGLFPVPRQG